MSICCSETYQIHHNHVVKKIILLHQGIVRSLILYIDFHLEMFLKESQRERSFQLFTGV